MHNDYDSSARCCECIMLFGLDGHAEWVVGSANESLAWFIGLKGMHYGWPQEEI